MFLHQMSFKNKQIRKELYAYDQHTYIEKLTTHKSTLVLVAKDNRLQREMKIQFSIFIDIIVENTTF